MPDYTLSDIAAATGNGGGNGNGNGLNGDGGWLILFLFILLGGFGNNRGWGGNGGYGAGNVGGNELYPWLNNAENINGGFRDQMIQTSLQGIQTQGQNLATQLCNCCADLQQALANGFAGVNLGMSNGFAGVNNNLCNGFNQTQVGMLNGFNATQNTINQGFNATNMGMMQGFNGVNMQTAQLASDIQLGNAQQTATILAENCADRAALSDGVRDIIASQTAGVQRILDKLCDQELFAERRENDNLRQQLNMQTLAASQAAQNAFITQGFANEVDALYNRLNNCPVPSMPVYGRTPIFTCNGQNPCGCGCAA